MNIENLASMQDETEKDIRGPPCKSAFDNEGKPTKVIRNLAWM